MVSVDCRLPGMSWRCDMVANVACIHAEDSLKKEVMEPGCCGCVVC